MDTIQMVIRIIVAVGFLYHFASFVFRTNIKYDFKKAVIHGLWTIILIIVVMGR